MWNWEHGLFVGFHLTDCELTDERLFQEIFPATTSLATRNRLGGAMDPIVV
jgi:hypothetical protein